MNGIIHTCPAAQAESVAFETMVDSSNGTIFVDKVIQYGNPTAPGSYSTRMGILVCRTQDPNIRAALIGLGWTPPPKVAA